MLRLTFRPESFRLKVTISSENPIGFIKANVDSLSLDLLGISVEMIKSEMRLRFDTKLFLKKYLHGYLNCLRSSNKF